MDYAKQNKFDYVWFIDSDIIINNQTLHYLLNSNADVSYCPYKLKYDNRPLIGVILNNTPQVIDTSLPQYQSKYIYNIVGGFGCTLVRSTAFDVTITYGIGSALLDNSIHTYAGEDIEFYKKCLLRKLTTACICGHYIQHLCDRKINICHQQ